MYDQIVITITDSLRKKIIKNPDYYNCFDTNDCILFEWHRGKERGFYDCNRTYFHFEKDRNIKTFEGDFMHYKCSLTCNQIILM